VNAVTPPGISAAFLNAIENVLEQPSGGTETGKYNLQSWGNAANDTIGSYTGSISRTAVPISVVIDTADQAATAVNAPATAFLTANGFLASTTTTGAATVARVAGNYTLNY
jgi:hypothetical protein